MRRPSPRHLVVAVGAAVAFAIVGGTPALAHPLGNFSINHLDTLRFESTRVIDDAIVDTAEIPTAQAADTIDSNGDGTASAAELQHYGAAQCESYRSSLSLTVDGQAVTFSTLSSTFEYRPGQAGLQTTRLECELSAPADFSVARTVDFENGFAPNRVGWKEINASADGAQIVDSPVSATSVTKGLTTYPVDLLSSPLSVRAASFTIHPGQAPSTVKAPAKPARSEFSKAIGPFSSVVDRVTKTFNDLVGRRQLTVSVGLLAIGLALILGASHALLPGHGKTVMAAYIAGRQGSVRDAVLVGATVTATHTGGVLILGLALTLSTSLAGESVLGWLGVVSGVMIAVLGASLLRGAIRRRRNGESPSLNHGHSHGRFGHSHGAGDHSHGGHSHSHGDHSHDHDDQDHGHDHGHPHPRRVEPALATALGGELQLVAAGRQSLVAGTRLMPASSGLSASSATATPVEINEISLLDFATAPGAPPSPSSLPRSSFVDTSRFPDETKHFSRRGLIGMGIAGGLVPSPSALVVLLSAIALGRTVFGVVLVIGYGAGMAGTLTLAGVLLVRLRDRYQRTATEAPGRVRAFANRWSRLAPYCTAGLVLVVGLGLAIRSLGSV